MYAAESPVCDRENMTVSSPFAYSGAWKRNYRAVNLRYFRTVKGEADINKYCSAVRHFVIALNTTFES